MVKQFRNVGGRIHFWLRTPMPEKDIGQIQVEKVGDLDVRSENIAFDPSKMSSCHRCGRNNPPNRLICLYCGFEFETLPEGSELTDYSFRRLEDWEPGFNVILIPDTDSDDSPISKAAKIVRIESEHLRTMMENGRSFPVLRLASEKHARHIELMLTDIGLHSKVISDESLMPDRSPVRLRSIEINGPTISLIEFNTGANTEIDVEDLVLIVPGVISETTVDKLEKKGRRGKSKVIDEYEASSDQPILDIYDRLDPAGFRVMLTGFDFSCLGANKGLIAAQNIKDLAGLLSHHAPQARLIDHYRSVREDLSNVWEITRRKDSKGLQRSGFAKLDFGNTETTSNLTQMNRFSRLQWHLL